MQRSTLDKLISSLGLVLAIVLVIASGLMFYSSNFIHTQVKTQLNDQRITFPEINSDQVTSLPAEDQKLVAQYAGQQLLTGKQAKIFADNYIAVHIDKIGGGKTYSELSSASMADPADTKLAAQVQTVFRGETLRGLLLNAYAFDTVATIAKIGALVALGAAAVLLVLVAAGFGHAQKVSKPKKLAVTKKRR